MPFDEHLAGRIREALARKRGIAEKRMFGGSVFLLNGNILVGIWRNWLLARLGPEQGPEALRQPYVKKMDITGKPMRGWIMVEPEGVADDDQLQHWIQQALQFVRTLPGK
ncbi:MAG: TfoX/Sxy family protein [Planctomycetes bacterium]|nr:TfoX/Sxy family protein [Planctomycetota bacterium]